MKLPKALSLITLAFGSILPLSANEYKFEEIKFDQTEKKQNLYEPKDKLDEYIIKAATYSTKFVPLMNNGADGSEYTSLIAKRHSGRQKLSKIIAKNSNFPGHIYTE